VLATALRRAARGLAPHPAAELGSVDDGPPVARVVEVYAPAETANDVVGTPHGTGATAPIAILAAALLAAAALTARRRARRDRPPATLGS
jgi:hypothetical protein